MPWKVPVDSVAARANEAVDDVSNERDAHEERTRWCCSDRLGKHDCVGLRTLRTTEASDRSYNRVSHVKISWHVNCVG